jgi:hypothetical protein
VSDVVRLLDQLRQRCDLVGTIAVIDQIEAHVLNITEENAHLRADLRIVRSQISEAEAALHKAMAQYGHIRELIA